MNDDNAPIIFEEIKKKNENNAEFWSARDLANILGYSEYRHFLPVIEKANEACINSKQPINEHFEDYLDMIKLGHGAERPINDIKLSRYAGYLVMQNADPSKEIVALGQTYFAIQTRRQEIHHKKGLKKSQKILDFMGSEELAANLFRATQTDAKLRREQIKGEANANHIHQQVGKKIRETIKELGGTMPENLAVPGAITQAKKRLKNGSEKLKIK